MVDSEGLQLKDNLHMHTFSPITSKKFIQKVAQVFSSG